MPDRFAGARVDWDVQFRRHHRRLELHLVAKGIPLHLAEELAQETWTRLIRKCEEGRFEHITLPGLALREADYVALDHFRERKSRRETSLTVAEDDAQDAQREREIEDKLVSDQPQPEDALVRSQTRDAVRAALEQLSAGQREIVEKYYFDEMNAPDIASTRGITPQRVREVLCTARRRVASLLGEK